MSSEMIALMMTAATLGFVHTLFGPDHYVPFIAMSKARQWAFPKTMIITFLCGMGHILSSVILGFLGIVLGVAVIRLEAIESVRGEWAGWLLLIFGFTYFVWGIHQALRNRPHTHFHIHDDGITHAHNHAHAQAHAHVHDEGAKSITPWVLFTIFVFGPCEPLIPILMYPAMTNGSLFPVTLVAGVFALATIGTMMTLVAASSLGLARLPMGGLERFSHALAGFAIFACGGAMTFLGL
ncbi:MAG: hypothetical protein JW893_05395 [Candidatus Omnitrophica bacterium]|nr:hypothetical protein [Candidatus Omnitrophota bacterium]